MNYNFKHPIEAFRNQIMNHNVQALQKNWGTFNFENKSKYKKKIKINKPVDPSESVKYFDLALGIAAY